MPITALPTPPSATRPATYAAEADAFNAALDAFADELIVYEDASATNAVTTSLNVTQAATKAIEAQNAAISASSAALAVGAVVWVTGLTYAIGDLRFSPINYMTYRRKTVGAGSTDPSADTTNWAPYIVGYITSAGEETLTNKKISAYQYLDRTVTNAACTGTVTLDLALGSTFDLTLTGNTTLQLTNVPALTNETLNIVISVTQGAIAYSLTWFGTMTWITPSGIEPAAPAANKVIEYIITSKAAGQYKGRKGAST